MPVFGGLFDPTSPQGVNWEHYKRCQDQIARRSNMDFSQWQMAELERGQNIHQISYGASRTIGDLTIGIQNCKSRKDAALHVLRGFIEAGVWYPPIRKVRWWHFWRRNDPLIDLWNEFGSEINLTIVEAGQDEG